MSTDKREPSIQNFRPPSSFSASNQPSQPQSRGFNADSPDAGIPNTDNPDTGNLSTNDLEVKGGISELERINLQIESYTEQINELSDARNKAYKYKNWLKDELKLRGHQPPQ